MEAAIGIGEDRIDGLDLGRVDRDQQDIVAAVDQRGSGDRQEALCPRQIAGDQRIGPATISTGRCGTTSAEAPASTTHGLCAASMTISAASSGPIARAASR